MGGLLDSQASQISKPQGQQQTSSKKEAGEVTTVTGKPNLGLVPSTHLQFQGLQHPLLTAASTRCRGACKLTRAGSFTSSHSQVGEGT